MEFQYCLFLSLKVFMEFTTNLCKNMLANNKCNLIYLCMFIILFSNHFLRTIPSIFRVKVL